MKKKFSSSSEEEIIRKMHGGKHHVTDYLANYDLYDDWYDLGFRDIDYDFDDEDN